MEVFFLRFIPPRLGEGPQGTRLVREMRTEETCVGCASAGSRL